LYLQIIQIQIENISQPVSKYNNNIIQKMPQLRDIRSMGVKIVKCKKSFSLKSISNFERSKFLEKTRKQEIIKIKICKQQL
jgi:predicted peroxiredoxin